MRPLRVEPTSVDCLVTPLPAGAWRCLAAAVLVAGVLGAFLLPGLAWFDPADLAPVRDYALDEKDSTAFVLDKARSPARDAADVLVLGSSATREALATDSVLSLAGAGSVLKLTSSAQNPLESLFLLQQRPLRAGQLVVLFTGVTQLGVEDYAARLGRGMFLQDPTAFARAHPALGVAAPLRGEGWRHRLMVLQGGRRLLVRYLHHAVPHQLARTLYGVDERVPLEFQYDAMDAQALRQNTENRSAMRARLERVASANLPAYSEMLDAFALHCRRAGATLVLAENPHLAADLETTFAPWWHDYRRAVSAVASRHGLRYADANAAMALPATAFNDAIHLSAAGRSRWSGRFTDDLAAWRREGH